MTSITVRPDDSGLQSLRRENCAAPAEQALSAAQAIARIRAVGGQEQRADQPQAPAQYAGPERRQGERRQGQQRVILDTRSKRERRRQPPPDDGGSADDVRLGIDVYS